MQMAPNLADIVKAETAKAQAMSIENNKA